MARFHVCMPVVETDGGFACYVCRKDMAAEMLEYRPEGAKLSAGAARGARPSEPRPEGWGSARRARRLRLG